MKKDELVYVRHMLDTARSVADKARRAGRAEFDRNEDFRLALTHLIQTLGESARRVPEGFRKAHPGIPWSQIVGMRHKVVHDYLEVDFDLVWEAATIDVPPLIAMLEAIVPPDPSSTSGA